MFSTRCIASMLSEWLYIKTTTMEPLTMTFPTSVRPLKSPIPRIITYFSILDHCLDAIRQYIQCAGITTLVPTKFREGAQRNYIDSDQVHTCRSFTYLRDWATSRRAGGPAYVERDRSIIDLRKNKLAEKKMAAIVDHMHPPS
jgi:hypothetical protein